MSKRTGSFIGGVLATAVFAFHGPAGAEDLDLFVQPPGEIVGIPNVLIVLDNTANWSRTVDGQAININEIKALRETLEGLEVNDDGSAKFRVGLMLFTETGKGDSTYDGGYLRAAVRDMNDLPDKSSGTKAKYSALLASLDELADKSNGGKAGKTMSEVYQYYKGLQPFSGNNKVKTDYRGNTSGTAQSRAVYELVDDVSKHPNNGNALESKAGTRYNSPIDPASCGGNYIIYISNGAVQDNSADNKTASQQLAAAALVEGIASATTAISISPSGSQDNVADEWARFMHRSSVGAITYTVDVDKISTGQGPGWTALLRSMANVSSGKYFDVTSGSGGASISDALGRIFSEIQAVNSVFASVSLPVSVNTEGTFLNQVYIGMFRPDRDAYPRWPGNLKQYKLGLVGTNLLRTLDADSNQAINATTGFITECARSFWTPTTTDTYWMFKPQGGCLAVPGADNSNYPDGNIVEKGAQGYVLRSNTTRLVQTCSATFGSCTSLVTFNTTNVSPTDLGVTTTTERDQLVNWARGLDVPVPNPNPDGVDGDENLNGVTMTEMRPSAHGDVVHSRPVAVNFGTDASPKVVVFYGANDGVMRAVNGNRSNSIGSYGAGREMWAFVPPEFFPYIKRIRDNNTQISFKDNPTTEPLPQPKPYGIDGPMAVYQDSPLNPTKTWLYAAMRRGGRALYAFNVNGFSNITPTTPTLMWKRGCPNQTNNTGCSSGFDDIGQTWSAPRVIKTNYGGSKPMLIMGGGYDVCEDIDPRPDSCSDPKGDHVYVLDAQDGSLLATKSTTASVVADVFVVPDGNTGRAKFAYAADMLGNIYRISGVDAYTPFGATDPGNWTVTKIASLGCDDGTDNCTSRKFMFSPDVVEESGTYYLLIGSGDREKPLRNYSNAYKTSNYFFMVMDNPADPDWVSGGPITLGDLVTIPVGGDPDPDQLASSKGWALALGRTDNGSDELGYACADGSDSTCHEQVVTSAITVFGVTTFSTHTPTEPARGACTSNLGTAKVYNIRFRNAANANGTNNRDQVVSGGGLPPSPVAGQVTLDNGVTVPFLIGGDPDSPLEGTLPVPAASSAQPKSVTYWYIEK
jgi:type IV pilus assembly protein PilY1